jgi:DNA invertase Pin-like site-specific DNA recombinase
MDKTGIIYCYDLEGEVRRLSDLAHRHGWAITQTIIEKAATAPDRRAGLPAIRRMVAKGEVHALVVPSLLMLGASLDETVGLVAKMAATKADLIIEAEGIDTSTIEGAAWLAAVASLQGYKEAVRRENARAGQRRARESGVHCGRPALKPAIVNKLNALLRSGHGVRAASRLAGCSPARAAAEKKAMMAAENFL